MQKTQKLLSLVPSQQLPLGDILPPEKRRETFFQFGRQSKGRGARKMEEQPIRLVDSKIQWQRPSLSKNHLVKSR